MDKGKTASPRGGALAVTWAGLIAATAVFVALLELTGLPAALLLGAMLAAMLISVLEGKVAVPRWPYLFAQGVIGCLIAHSISGEILATMAEHWPLFLICIFTVIFFSTGLGALLAWGKVLPGSTAVWGSAPGAASAMVLMSEAYGGDVRLVAFMQYLRVVFVASAASIVATLWVSGEGSPLAATVWFPPVDLVGFGATLGLAALGAVAGTYLKVPAGPLLIPLVLGVVLAVSGLVTIVLPPWLLAISYAMVGWAIGLRFTRSILLYAAKAFPRVAASILVLIALCGGLGYLVHIVTGVDMLTAYLATSPGGADSVAIIAASSPVDVPFVMAMQTGRFLVVLMVGPSLARLVARWTLRWQKQEAGHHPPAFRE